MASSKIGTVGKGNAYEWYLRIQSEIVGHQRLTAMADLHLRRIAFLDSLGLKLGALLVSGLVDLTPYLQII